MLKIYHAPRSRSVRPIWLCFELGIEPDIVTVTPELKASKEWLQISPAGKIPAMVDHDVCMTESGAINDYLLDKYGQGRLHPEPGTRASAEYRQWCWFAEATLIRPLGVYRLLRASGEDADQLATDAKQKFHEAMRTVEVNLKDREYLLGDAFSAADIMMGYSVAMTQVLLQNRYPKTSDYLARLQSRKSFQRVLKLDQTQR